MPLENNNPFKLAVLFIAFAIPRCCVHQTQAGVDGAIAVAINVRIVVIFAQHRQIIP